MSEPMLAPDQQVIGVKEFVGIINETLGFAYPAVTVEGEVSGYKVSAGKWVFFDLKEADVTLGCFMPVYALKVPLEDGMRIRASGSPKLTNWGKFSFTVRSLELAGEGELKRAFALLKGRLEAEGLFDPARKRPLPAYPQTIGLITSATSAAYADFMKILGARWGGVTVQVADVLVQGQSASDQIVAAIEYFDQARIQPDALVLVRGGGSLEDLQAFNTEMVARAVARTRVPIVVGVGHEVDTSLADLAADVRAATPTDAARLVVPDRLALGQAVASLASRIQIAELAQLGGLSEKLNTLTREVVSFFDLDAELNKVNQLADAMRIGLRDHATRWRERVDSLARLITAFDPAATLARGYAIVRAGERVVVRPDQAPVGTPIVIQLARGQLHAKTDRSPS